MVLPLLFPLLFQLLCMSRAAKLDLNAEVIELTSRNWHKTKQGIWLVEFYAPWCGHCKKLAPVYEEAAKFYHRAESPIVSVGKVDGTQEPSLLSSFNVLGYPTIFLLRDGRRVATFDGKRDLKGIQEFVAQHSSGDTEAAARRPPSTSTRKASASRKTTWASRLQGIFASITAVDPLTVGLTAMCLFCSCSMGLLLMLCLASPQRAARAHS